MLEKATLQAAGSLGFPQHTGNFQAHFFCLGSLPFPPLFLAHALLVKNFGEDHVERGRNGGKRSGHGAFFRLPTEAVGYDPGLLGSLPS